MTLFSPLSILQADTLSAAIRAPGRPARDAGIVPSASVNQTAAINAAIQEAKAAGGGKLIFEPGTYLGNVEIDTGVTLQGVRGATTIAAPGGSNKPVLTTPNFAAMVGTNDGAGASPHRFAVLDLDLDGRSSLQTTTGSGRDLCSGVQLYGYAYALSGLFIRNALGAALRCEWGAFGEFPMESAISNINIDTCNRHGVWFNGPHDTLSSTIVIVDAGQEADNTYCGAWTGAQGQAQWTQFHAWHRAATTNRMRASFSAGTYCQVANSQFEGGRVLFEARAGDSVSMISASRFYASFGSAGAGMLDCLGSSVTVGGGCIFHNTTAADVFAIRIGRSGAPVSGITVDPGTLFYGFTTRGPYELAGDAGLNRLGGMGYGNAAPATINSGSRMDYLSSGPYAAQYYPGLPPGPFATDTAAKAAGLVFGMPYLKTGGSMAWVST